MYFLGIDPGIRKLGYGLIDQDLRVVDAGVVLQDGKRPSRKDQFHRMEEIMKFFTDLLQRYQISGVGIEKLYFTDRNQSNAEFVYGVRGVLMVLFAQHQIPVVELTPQELKKHITGNGNASKELMLKVITRVYKLKVEPERHDTADALGLAFLVAKMSG